MIKCKEGRQTKISNTFIGVSGVLTDTHFWELEPQVSKTISAVRGNVALFPSTPGATGSKVGNDTMQESSRIALSLG